VDEIAYRGGNAEGKRVKLPFKAKEQ